MLGTPHNVTSLWEGWLRAGLAQCKSFLVHSPPEVVLQEHHVRRPVRYHGLPVVCDDQRVHAEHPLTGNRRGLETAVGPEVAGEEWELGLVQLSPVAGIILADGFQQLKSLNKK